MALQHELDDLAHRNGWQVNTALRKSVYARGSDTVILWFNPSGALTSADRIISLDVSANDWLGKINNILRHRWRT